MDDELEVDLAMAQQALAGDAHALMRLIHRMIKRAAPKESLIGEMTERDGEAQMRDIARQEIYRR